MSDLFELVNTKYELEKYTPDSASARALAEFRSFVNQAETGFQVEGIEHLHNEYQKIEFSIKQFNDEYDAYIDSLYAEIENLEPDYFAASRNLYDNDMLYETDEYILDRTLSFSDDIMSYITSRIEKYGDWHHPGLVIRPGRGEWIKSLVRLDPLYVVDQSAGLLTPSIELFNQQYQNKINDYVVDERSGAGFLSRLPQEQFGYILAYNFFNYKPLEVVISYLEEIWGILRPGGKFAFTFNDCDRPGGVSLAMKNFTCYTPGRYLEEYIEDRGYHIAEWQELDNSNTWVELEKSGELESIRGGQSLVQLKKYS